MSESANSLRITQTAATAAALLGFEAPQGADVPESIVLHAAERVFHGEKAERLLLYNPDAVALWIYQKYTARFEPVLLHTQLDLPVRSVMPSVTPVCFASMYAGVTPDVHGIQAYVKPVLRVQTLFDAALAAGKRPVIVSTAGDSISKIFLERRMDYFIYDTPDECNAKAVELMQRDEHDLIVVYNGNYDGTMHRFGPESPEALAALDDNANAFAMLSGAAAKFWDNRRYGVAFLPDHGCHEIDGGCGSHGLDMPEDMNIIHFYGFHTPEKY